MTYNILNIYAVLLITITAITVQAEQQFFRLISPYTTKITSITTNGWMSWSNSTVSGTSTIERSMNIVNSNDWNSYIQHSTTSIVMHARLFSPDTPNSMAYIPAGIFRMGDSFGEGLDWELPVHTVYISEFYMDKHEVTKLKWDNVAIWASTHGYDICS